MSHHPYKILRVTAERLQGKLYPASFRSTSTIRSEAAVCTLHACIQYSSTQFPVRRKTINDCKKLYDKACTRNGKSRSGTHCRRCNIVVVHKTRRPTTILKLRRLTVSTRTLRCMSRHSPCKCCCSSDWIQFLGNGSTLPYEKLSRKHGTVMARLQDARGYRQGYRVSIINDASLRAAQ